MTSIGLIFHRRHTAQERHKWQKTDFGTVSRDQNSVHPVLRKNSDEFGPEPTFSAFWHPSGHLYEVWSCLISIICDDDTRALLELVLLDALC